MTILASNSNDSTIVTLVKWDLENTRDLAGKVNHLASEKIIAEEQ